MSKLKEYFVFSSSERRGIFLFSILLLLMILAYFSLPFFVTSTVATNDEFKTELAQLLAKNESSSSNAKTRVDEVVLFKFNPNTLSHEGFLSLGLSAKQTKTIINYRSKGGKFYKKEDFKKIYSITQQDYSRLSPYLSFAKKKNLSSNKVVYGTTNNEQDSLFQFDPNTVARNELRLLGFSEKQASVFLNYRNKGAKFYKPEDVSKVYGVTDKLYANIESFISITPAEDNYQYKKEVKKNFVIEINTATAEEFKQISGIGEKISARIVKYRDRIGGFYSVAHLAEVYGVEMDLIEENTAVLTVDNAKIKKINLNEVTISEFYKHPYVSFNDARKIVNFREVHGLFTAVDEIRTNDLVKEEVYSKIVNYLILQ